MMECNVLIFFKPKHGVVIKKVVILVITMSLTPLATALHILLFTSRLRHGLQEGGMPGEVFQTFRSCAW